MVKIQDFVILMMKEFDNIFFRYNGQAHYPPFELSVEKSPLRVIQIPSISECRTKKEIKSMANRYKYTLEDCSEFIYKLCKLQDEMLDLQVEIAGKIGKTKVKTLIDRMENGRRYVSQSEDVIEKVMLTEFDKEQAWKEIQNSINKSNHEWRLK